MIAEVHHGSSNFTHKLNALSVCIPGAGSKDNDDESSTRLPLQMNLAGKLKCTLMASGSAGAIPDGAMVVVVMV